MEGQKIYLKCRSGGSRDIGTMWIKCPNDRYREPFLSDSPLLFLAEIKDGIECWTLLTDVPFFANASESEINDFWKD